LFRNAVQFAETHGITTQKTILFTFTTERTSSLSLLN